jgi:hypothetical protein
MLGFSDETSETRARVMYTVTPEDSDDVRGATMGYPTAHQGGIRDS